MSKDPRLPSSFHSGWGTRRAPRLRGGADSVYSRSTNCRGRSPPGDGWPV